MPDSESPRILFQRRHYDAIAEVIRALGCVTEFERMNIATEFGLRIAQTNPRFDRARFTEACMPPVPVREPYIPQEMPPPVTDVAPAPTQIQGDWVAELTAAVADVPGFRRDEPTTAVRCCIGGCDRPATHIHRTTGGRGPDHYCEPHSASCCSPIDPAASYLD